MYRTRREARYIKLRKYGFTRFEARPLSKVPTSVCPYFRELMRERQALMKKALKMGKSEKEYTDSIKELYRVNRWAKVNRAGKIVADPWKMLREYEDRWKQKNPNYTSPWMKRWRNWKDFQRKVENTLRKQRG